MTNDKDFVLGTMISLGRLAALNLRETASTMTANEIIEQAAYIPDFDTAKDYTTAPVGSPVGAGGEYYTLKKQHNPANEQYTDPSERVDLWTPITSITATAEK